MGTHGTSEPWGRIPRNVPLTAEGRQPLSEGPTAICSRLCARRHYGGAGVGTPVSAPQGAW